MVASRRVKQSFHKDIDPTKVCKYDGKRGIMMDVDEGCSAGCVRIKSMTEKTALQDTTVASMSVSGVDFVSGYVIGHGDA